MQRKTLIEQLGRYDGYDVVEKAMINDTIYFIGKHADCFERSHLTGHITASAWVVNPELTHALMIHHVKLDKWLQPGGHCDGDPDVLGVAMKETLEETGLVCSPVLPGIFDVDIHAIPAKADIPSHFHYDIRFLLQVPMHTVKVDNEREIKAIRWLKLEDVRLYNESPSIGRMVDKTLLLTL